MANDQGWQRETNADALRLWQRDPAGFRRLSKLFQSAGPESTFLQNPEYRMRAASQSFSRTARQQAARGPALSQAHEHNRRGALQRLDTSDISAQEFMRMARVAREGGTRLPLVYRDVDAAEHHLMLRSWDQAMREDPFLAHWMNNPRNAAAARDDHAALTRVSRAAAPLRLPGPFASIVSASEAFSRTVDAWSMRALEAHVAIRRQTKRNAKGLLERSIEHLRSGIMELEADYFTTMGALYQFSGEHVFYGSGEADLEAARQYHRKAQLAWSAAEAPIRGETTLEVVRKSNWRPTVVASFAIEQGARALPEALVSKRVPVVGALFQLAKTAHQRAVNDKRVDADPMDFLYAVPSSAINFSIDHIPLAGASGSFLKRWATTTGQEVLKAAGQEIIKYGGSVLGTKHGFHWGELRDAALGATFGGLVMSQVTFGSRSASTHANIVRTRWDAELLDELAHAARLSKTRVSTPDEFADFLGRRLSGGRGGTLYVPADAIASHLRSSRINASEHPLWREHASALEHAQRHGGDIVVPTSKLLTVLAGTPELDALKPDIRLRAGGISAREADRLSAELYGRREPVEAGPAPAPAPTPDRSRADEPWSRGEVVFDPANPRLFLQRSGSTWFRRFRELGQGGNTHPELRAEWVTLAKWLGVDPAGRTAASDHAAEKRLGEAVERYATTGQAPTPELAPVFQNYQTWLRQSFISAKARNDAMSPAAEQVTMRVLAGHGAFAQARAQQHLEPLLTADNGARSAKGAALRALLDRTLAVTRAARSPVNRPRIKALREEAAHHIDALPLFRAQSLMRAGARLDRDRMIERFGKAAVDALPEDAHGPGGIAPDLLAEQAGFDTAESLVRALLGAQAEQRIATLRQDARSARDRAADEQARILFEIEHGDPLALGTLQREAREVLHSDAQGRLLARDVKLLDEKHGGPERFDHLPWLEARRWARKQLPKGQAWLHADHSEMELHLRNAELQGRIASESFAAGHFGAAAEAKHRQMLNSALVVEAKRVRAEARLSLHRAPREPEQD